MRGAKRWRYLARCFADDLQEPGERELGDVVGEELRACRRRRQRDRPPGGVEDVAEPDRIVMPRHTGSRPRRGPGRGSTG